MPLFFSANLDSDVFGEAKSAETRATGFRTGFRLTGILVRVRGAGLPGGSGNLPGRFSPQAPLGFLVGSGAAGSEPGTFWAENAREVPDCPPTRQI